MYDTVAPMYVCVFYTDFLFSCFLFGLLYSVTTFSVLLVDCFVLFFCENIFPYTDDMFNCWKCLLEMYHKKLSLVGLLCFWSHRLKPVNILF